MKARADKLKFTRPQIQKFLMKRYSVRFSNIVVKFLNFPQNGTYDEYCQTIDNFIASTEAEKKRLCF